MTDIHSERCGAKTLNILKKGVTANISRRFAEIDILRGIAIVMMILFHLLFDLEYFGIFGVNTSSGFWRLFGYSTAILFVAVAGLSIHISMENAQSKGYFSLKYYLKFLKRGLFLILIGIGISIVTWLAIGEGWIVYGILSLIGTSVILAPLFKRFKVYNLAIGVFVIALGLLMHGIYNIHGAFYLIPLGITPENFYTVDYEPLFPWFGIFLLGMAAGSILYPEAKRRFELKMISDAIHNRGLQSICSVLKTAGRHSLIIYLLHQPILILILTLITGRMLL